MIVQVFNSSIVSGPETLVIPAMRSMGEPVAIVFLSETRLAEKSKEPPAYARSLGLDTYEIQVRSRWDKQAILDLRALLERLAPRVVHAHEVKAAAYLAYAAKGPRNYKIVTTNHGVRSKKRFSLRFYEWIYTHVLMPKFDAIYTVCSSDRDILLKKGVNAKHVFTHLNGVDKFKVHSEFREKERSRIHAEWKINEMGVGSNTLCIGVVGRLSVEKRHRYILEILSKLDSKLDVKLIVFGRGPLDSELCAYAKELNVEERVCWLGYRGTVGDEMAGFDILLSLSIAEGLPINVIEAAWAGTPVIATAVDGNLDLIPDTKFGILFPVDEAAKNVALCIEALTKEPKKLSEIGLNLQSRVEVEFSGSKWLQRLKELYSLV